MQKEYFGVGSLAVLERELQELGCKRLLLVHGQDSYLSSGAKQLIDPQLDGLGVIEFSSFSPNPKFEEVQIGASLITGSVGRELSIEAIVAVGGGSCIDVAKSINLFAANKGQELRLATGELTNQKKLLPLVAIPTTAGTGSEATHFSVIYINGKKYSLASPEMKPAISILDPTLTDNLPQPIRASSAFDALSQSVESYWAAAATPESRHYADLALHQILQYLTDSIVKGDKNAHAKMLQAANYSGKAIDISKTTAPHALSYSITSKLGIPHGHAVALTLGAFFPFHDNQIKYNQSIVSQTLVDATEKIYGALEVANGFQARDKWRSLMRECNLETDFKSVGLDAQMIEEIVDEANPQRLANHPLTFTPESLSRLLLNELAET